MAVNERTWTLSNALLDAVVSGYEAEELTLPKRRLVAEGTTIVPDDELLAVSMLRIYGASPEAGPAAELADVTRCLFWRAAQFEVLLLRCTAVGSLSASGEAKPPTVEQIEESARAVQRDAMLLQTSILSAYRADAYGVGPTLAFEDWAAVGPDGGLVGGRLRLRIGLV